MATASTHTNRYYGPTGSIGLTGSSGQYLSSATGSYTSFSQKTKYIILDKEVEVNGYTDPVVAMYISMINLAGKKFYDEVKKQGVNFPKEIEEFLQKELISWERNRKLDIIL